VHYRDNWYVDAWCHMREGLRSFAVDAIRAAELRDARAKEIPAAELDAHLGSGYGIFAGRDVQWAVLRFTPEAARWVSAQVWHPKQRARFEADGSYVLEVPYAHDRELLMEIFKANAVELVGADQITVNPNDRNTGGSTDMGDLAHIMPVVHPYAGGATGTGHGNDYLIQDYEVAVINPAVAMAMSVIDLLADNAAKAREVLAKHTPAMTKAQYLKLQSERLREELYEG